MKLLRFLVAAIALSMAFGLTAGQVTAKPSPAKQAKKLCKKKKGKAKKKCVTKQTKRLKAKAKRERLKKKRAREKAKRERLKELNTPGVTIRTTEGGIPRIVADSYNGLGYGYGWSLAKENICSMADIYTTVRGERSKYFGPEGKWMLTGNGIEYNNLESDFSHKRVIAEKTIEGILKQKPPMGPLPEVKQVVTGFVKGYNLWLTKNQSTIEDETCAGKPWVKKINANDVWLRFFELATMAGSGAAVDGIANAQPPGMSSASVQSEDLASGDPSVLAEPAAIGSNAVSLGSESTTTGKGLLYGNPHFPWQGSERFFQSQLTIPGKLNVSGGSLLGSPVIQIGHTKGVAWSHTVSTARRFNLFRETLVPGQPTKYLVDGKPVSMKQTKVSVEKQDGTTETRTLYSTKHGPIATSVQKQPLIPWATDYAYALNDPNADGLRVVNQFFGFNRSESVADIRKALEDYQGVPWVNTIAADSEGNAMYADVSVVPNITDARITECNVEGVGDLLWGSAKVAVLDGSVTNCDMQKAPGAVAKGILPPSQMPVQIRKDYGSNMNDSFWLSNPAAPLEGFPSIIGNEKSERSLRTRNGLVQIEEGLAGGGKFSPTSLLNFIDNDRHHGAELMIPALVTYCQANPTINGVDVSEACGVLADWDLTDKLDSPGAYLGRQVIGRINGVSNRWNNPFSLSDPVHTPNGLNVSNAAVPKALADAVTDMTSKSIPLDAKWRDYQYVTKSGEKIPIPGGPGGQGVFNVITASRDAAGNYSSVNHGSSFIIMASMDGTKCPDVKTILTYSQAATNEKSPHFKDQTKLFSESKWVNDVFCASQQKQDPALQTANLNGGAKAVKKGW